MHKSEASNLNSSGPETITVSEAEKRKQESIRIVESLCQDLKMYALSNLNQQFLTLLRAAKGDFTIESKTFEEIAIKMAKKMNGLTLVTEDNLNLAIMRAREKLEKLK